MRKKILCFALFWSILFTQITFGQNNRAIGQWDMHLNYTQGKAVAQNEDYIYAATENGFFRVDKDDLSSETLTPLQGFHSSRVNALAYHEAYRKLFIAHEDGTIDVLIKNRRIRTVNDIAISTVVNDKRIFHFHFDGDLAYISTAFGIVVYDVNRDEIRATYQNIGPNGEQIPIYSTATAQGYLYAHAGNSIIRADLDQPNLIDFQAWSSFREVRNSRSLAAFQEQLFFSSDTVLYRIDEEDSVHLVLDDITFDPEENANIPADYRPIHQLRVAQEQLVVLSFYGIHLFEDLENVNFRASAGGLDALVDEQENLWISRSAFGLISQDVLGEVSFFTPSGPINPNVWQLFSDGGGIWGVGGGHSANLQPNFRTPYLYLFFDNSWTNFTLDDAPVQLNDLVAIQRAPNDPYLYLAAYGRGVVKWHIGNRATEEVYGEAAGFTNNADSGSTDIRINHLAIDDNANLWAIQSNLSSNTAGVYVKEPESERFFQYVLSGGNFVSDFLIDDFGHKWIADRNSGVAVYKEREGNFQALQQGEFRRFRDNNSGLPNNQVRCLAKDADGYVWIGTHNGLGVMFNTMDVFNPNADIQRIFVDADDGGGFLLRGEVITAIAVDGANNKWIGTQNNGLWYISENGRELIHHFTTENSPLISNSIESLAILDNGSVFIGTDVGIVSYRGRATAPKETHQDVVVYPNPVRPGYDGPIAVKGLVGRASVKISDASGKIVFETVAEGSQAVWNGRTFDGRKVASGVYYIHSTNEEGTETHTSKLLIVR